MSGPEFPVNPAKPKTAHEREIDWHIDRMRELWKAGKLDPRRPTTFNPGSREKLALIALRYEIDGHLWVTGDDAFPRPQRRANHDWVASEIDFSDEAPDL